MSPNVTRRRLIQGVGALGVAGVAGNALVSADDGSGAVQQDGAAFRVAHASPDAPGIDVTLEAADGGVGTETDAAGNGTGTATTAGGDGPLVEGLQFSDVSDYNELDPGTYQLRIVATENTGFLEGIFSDEEERVIYEDELELEAGTTYTAVAYGELAEADLGEAPTGTETPGIGEETETETDDGAGVGAETPTDSEETATDDGVMGEETPTDETETPGIGEETPTDDGGTGDGQVVVESLSFGEEASFDLEAGDYTLEFRETSATGGDTVGAETPEDDAIGQETETETESDGMSGDETETETDDGVGVETETETDDGALGSEGESAADRAFDVALLEDDLSAPGDSVADGTAVGAETETETDEGAIGEETETDTEGAVDQETATATEASGSSMTRIRVFHAVPDVDAMEIVAVEDSGGGGLFGGGGDENETETDTPTDGGAIGGEGAETPTDDAGEGGMTATAVGEETPTDDGTSVQEAQISPEGGSVYSGFAVGYFDPAAAGSGEETATDAGAPGVETDAAGANGTETETDVGVDVGQTNETATTADAADELVEEGDEEFQFVTVEDASDGERSDGGTGGGGLLPDKSDPAAASD